MADINQAKRILLAEYERERDELNLLISRLRRELGIGSEPVKYEVEPSTLPVSNGSQIKVEELVKPGDFYGMSQVGAAKVFLERRGERNTATLQEIAQALLRGKAIDTALDEKGMRNLSSNLSKSGDFKSIAKGRWGLAKWYGGKKKKQGSDAEGEKAETFAETAEEQNDA